MLDLEFGIVWVNLENKPEKLKSINLIFEFGKNGGG